MSDHIKELQTSVSALATNTDQQRLDKLPTAVEVSIRDPLSKIADRNS